MLQGGDDMNYLMPTDYVESAYKINYEELYKIGYRGIIFDIDNTLVEHDAPANDKAKALIKRLHDIGFEILFLSNNAEPRVKTFKEAVFYGSYIYKAAKPSADGYIRAMEKMGTNTRNTFAVGDQLFTDIWGANNAKIRCFLVEPVTKWKERYNIVIKRVIEEPILLAIKYKFKDKR